MPARAATPDGLGVAHFTYLPNWTGMVYVAFVFDVFPSQHRLAGRLPDDHPADA